MRQSKTAEKLHLEKANPNSERVVKYTFTSSLLGSKSAFSWMYQKKPRALGATVASSSSWLDFPVAHYQLPSAVGQAKNRNSPHLCNITYIPQPRLLVLSRSILTVTLPAQHCTLGLKYLSPINLPARFYFNPPPSLSSFPFFIFLVVNQ